jgi:hypothetical protein
MNSHTNPTKLAGSPCSCGGGATKPCSCGGGGCQADTMIRPRFFAGQLLTEDDLQSLEDYVLAKNRLHNRHLFGAGVVCGLEVLCDPCGGGHVAVQPGYALDCCGNDISLDCRLSLDINAMVRDLRRDQLGGYDCGDPCSEQQQNLAKPTQPAEPGQPGKPVEPPPPREYSLYVRYCEQESDPVSPYAVDEPCNAQSCEPSRIREGIRFELRCPQSASPGPELITSILHCFHDVIGIEAMSVDALNLDSLRTQVAAGVTGAERSFKDLRARLLDVVDRSPHLVKCKLREKILAVPAPVQTPVPGAGPPNADSPATPALTAVFLEVLMECICMALNPPCTPCDDTGVKLACIKVQNCDVIEICNMSRHFVLAPTSLRYWLSFAEIERMLAAACCSPPKLRRGVDQRIGADFAPMRAAAAAAAEGGTDQGGTGTGGDTKPPDPPTAESEGAMKLGAIARALAEMNPKSDTGTRFDRLAKAFTALSGSQTPSPGEDEVSRAERAAIDSSIAAVVKDKIDPQTVQIKETLDEVSKPKEQVAALTAKIGSIQPPRETRPTRTPRPPRESEPK